MAGKIKNRINIRYGYLIVTKFTGIHYDNYCSYTLWDCKCDCGKETIVRGSHLQSGSTKSCGCLQREKANKLGKERIGEKAHHYIHGFRSGKATLKFNEKIRKRDNYTCQDCNMMQKEHIEKYNKKLNVHHIDNNDENNVEENMISLCRSCHGKRHKILRGEI